MQAHRAFLVKSFCHGRGIEIGAMHHPVPLPPELKVRYLDRFSISGLRDQYKEIKDQPMVEVDIVDNGETLATLPDASEDFIIACQFIEHCQNPVRAIVNMLRVVRNQGFVLITAPDKRFTFDVDRPITTNQHILDECLHGTEHTALQHFREWTTLVDKITDPVEAEKSVQWLVEKDYSIHFHVWDSDAFIQFLLFFKEQFKLPFELYATMQNKMELMVLLRKSLP